MRALQMTTYFIFIVAVDFSVTEIAKHHRVIEQVVIDLSSTDRFNYSSIRSNECKSQFENTFLPLNWKNKNNKENQLLMHDLAQSGALNYGPCQISNVSTFGL